jgi:hypothetical protein
VHAVIIMGGLSDFCLNFSPTVERLNLALHSALESLLLADAVDAIVGFDGKEHKKKVSMKRSSTTGGTNMQKNCKLCMEK